MISVLKRYTYLLENKYTTLIRTLQFYREYLGSDLRTVKSVRPIINQTLVRRNTCAALQYLPQPLLNNMEDLLDKDSVQPEFDESEQCAQFLDRCTSPPKKVFIMSAERVSDPSVRTVSSCSEFGASRDIEVKTDCNSSTVVQVNVEHGRSFVCMSVPETECIGIENKLGCIGDNVNTVSVVSECQPTDKAECDNEKIKLCDVCCAEHVAIVPSTLKTESEDKRESEVWSQETLCDSSTDVTYETLPCAKLNSEIGLHDDKMSKPVDKNSQDANSENNELLLKDDDNVATLSTHSPAVNITVSSCEGDAPTTTDLHVGVFSHFDDDIFLCESTPSVQTSSAVSLDKEGLFAELPFMDAMSLEDLTTLETPKKKKKKKSKKERKENKKKNEDGSEKRVRPNYFIAIQVSDPEIVLNLESVQKSIVAAKPALKPALISLKKLHITVKVIVISSEDDMKRAFEAMEYCRENLSKIISNPLKLQFETLGNFQHKVLFAAIIDKLQLEQLKLISDSVQSCFEASGFPADDDFKPHVTIAKLSKAPQLRRKKIKQISGDTYTMHKDQLFGMEEVKTLQLLSMVKPDANGYYHCVKEVFLEQDAKAGGDTALEMPEVKTQEGIECESTLQNTEAQTKTDLDNEKTKELLQLNEQSVNFETGEPVEAAVSVTADESVPKQSEVLNAHPQESNEFAAQENKMHEIKKVDVGVVGDAHHEIADAPITSGQQTVDHIVDKCITFGDVQCTGNESAILAGAENCASPLLDTVTSLEEICLTETKHVDVEHSSPENTDGNKNS